MGITVIGPTTQSFPSRAIPAVVQLKQKWSDDWMIVPELEFLGANASTAAHDVGSCALLHRYGVLKHPWNATDGRKSPASLSGCWVRVCFAGQQGFQEAWIGRIVGEVRTIFGPRQMSYGLIPAGAQCFEALGPLDMLRKIHVGRSFWWIGGEPECLNWAPPLNEKHGRTNKPAEAAAQSLDSGPIAKNPCSRSENRYADPVPVSSKNPKDKVYVYGGTELWNYHQYAEYLLKLFVDETYRGEGGDAQTIEAPITDVCWTGGDHPTTVISTGFAAEA